MYGYKEGRGSNGKPLRTDFKFDLKYSELWQQIRYHKRHWK